MAQARRVFMAAILAVSSSIVTAADNELVVYSGRSDKFIKPLVDQFHTETGVKVVLHSAESTALLNKLQVEGDKTQADLFISNDAGNLQLGSDAGLFRPVPTELAKVVPEQFRAADNTWLGLSARARVLVVNSDNSRAQSIKSIFDLADPQWKGRIGVINSTNESFISGATVYLQATSATQVEKWLEGVKANSGGEAFNKHGAIVSAVASGQKDVGLVNHYYVFRHLKEHPGAPIRIIFPDQGDQGMGVAWNVAGVAVSKYTKKVALAEKFVAFLVSDAGQKDFAEANFEYPTRPDVPAAAGVPAASTYKVAKVPMSALATHRRATIDLLEKVGMP